jgi:putative membrane protein
MRVAHGAALAFLFPVAAAAHGVGAANVADPRVFSLWDQAALAGLTILGSVYGMGLRKLRARRAVPPRFERVSFTLGWLALVASVLPWFDAAAIEHFSAHMAQHELMMIVGAPLIVCGRPLSTCLWAFGERWRKHLVVPLQNHSVAGAVSVIAAPMTAWLLHGLVVWLWHIPALYELAVRSEPIHTLQHATFISTSVLFWWGLVYGRYGRAGYGAAVFYVFTTAIHTGVLGALLTFAPTPLYGVYVTAAKHEALGDQQIAGLIMWIPVGLLLTLMGIGLFAVWLFEAKRREMADLPPTI